ncbi:uncharacterized protein LOC121734697 [Aricia agestis]|uniref:uncharacterized protein LOC121734697 n=1 Tax=Aricia agestis TaxID=91739 RepID=UPI001C209E84|nr:uncharacterized protein LOC121734697 [Aricia agestis]
MVVFMPRFKKCCCCLSLRTGSLVIGYVSMVLSCLALTGTSLSLYKVVTFVDSHKDEGVADHTPEEFERVALSLYITHAYLLLVFVYYFVISLLLVIGVHLNKSRILRYYFNAGLFLFCLALATVVVSTVFLHFVVTLSLLKWCLIIFYCLIMIRSTYLEMEEQSKPREFEMQNLYNPLRPPHTLYE